MNAGAVIPILGDQLSHEIAGLKAACRERDCVLMLEAHAEAHYAPYHKQKLTFIFSARRRCCGRIVLFPDADAPFVFITIGCDCAGRKR